MTVKASLPTAPRIRQSRGDDADINAIVALGRHVFSATFTEYTTPENMQLFFDTTYSYEPMKAILEAGDKVMFVAEIDQDLEYTPSDLTGVSGPRSRIAAFMSLCTSSSDSEPSVASYPKPLELRTIYIHPGFHSSGLAARLVGLAKDYAAEHGYRSMWLGVYPENKRAIRFYQKCGLEKVGSHAFRLGTQVDLDDIMAMRLGEQT